MPDYPTSVRLSDLDKRVLETLAEQLGFNNSQVVSVALRLMMAHFAPDRAVKIPSNDTIEALLKNKKG